MVRQTGQRKTRFVSLHRALTGLSSDIHSLTTPSTANFSTGRSTKGSLWNRYASILRE